MSKQANRPTKGGQPNNLSYQIFVAGAQTYPFIPTQNNLFYLLTLAGCGDLAHGRLGAEDPNS